MQSFDSSDPFSIPIAKERERKEEQKEKQRDKTWRERGCSESKRADASSLFSFSSFVRSNS